MKNLFIREARIIDAEKIIEFQKMMARETENISLDHETIYQGVHAVFADPYKGKYYVAEKNNEVIGSLLITFEWSDWRNSYIWWFQSVYIEPGSRRKGVFRQMCGHVRETAIQNNVPCLRLYVEKNNTKAQKTYEEMGMNSNHYKMYEWLK
ncbi:MAG TPA: GNAT family N-acetyltransferase [Bacteroidales bacterium]|nr:GNAT family N-acetyltransferase [Bacteroidales bacterium]